MPEYPTVVPKDDWMNHELSDLNSYMDSSLSTVDKDIAHQRATSAMVQSQGVNELSSYMDQNAPEPSTLGVRQPVQPAPPSIPADREDRQVQAPPPLRMTDSGDSAYNINPPKDYGPIQSPDRYTIAFGFRQEYDHPFNPNIPVHRGVDLVLPSTPGHPNGRGTPVSAFQPGTVAAITHDPDGGNGVIVQMPNGLYTRYFHFDQINPELQVGTKVSRATILGNLGATGTEGFPHVHFEVSKGINGDEQDALIDPRPYMEANGSPISPGDKDMPNAHDAFGAHMDLEGGFTLDNASDRVRGNIGFINKAAQATGVPQSVIAGLMDTEGSGSHSVSPAGAMGLMQVMPFHFKNGEDPFDPLTNITRGAEIVKANYQRYGNWLSAAAAYFGAVDQYGNPTDAQDAGGMDGKRYAHAFAHNADKYGGAPELGVVAKPNYSYLSNYSSSDDSATPGVSADFDTGAFSRYADATYPGAPHDLVRDSMLHGGGIDTQDPSSKISGVTDWQSILPGIAASASDFFRRAGDFATSTAGGLVGAIVKPAEALNTWQFNTYADPSLQQKKQEFMAQGISETDAINKVLNLKPDQKALDNLPGPHFNESDLDKRIEQDQNYGVENGSAIVATLEHATGPLDPKQRESIVNAIGPFLTPSNLVLLAATGGVSAVQRGLALAAVNGGAPTYIGLQLAKLGTEYATVIGGNTGAQAIAQAAGVQDPSSREAIGLIAGIAAPIVQSALLRKVLLPKQYSIPGEYAAEVGDVIEQGGPLAVRDSSASTPSNGGSHPLVNPTLRGGSSTVQAPLPPGGLPPSTTAGASSALPTIGSGEETFPTGKVPGGQIEKAQSLPVTGPYTNDFNEYDGMGRGNDLSNFSSNEAKIQWKTDPTRPRYLESDDGIYSIKATKRVETADGSIYEVEPGTTLYQLEIKGHTDKNTQLEPFLFSNRDDAAAVAQGFADLEGGTSNFYADAPNLIYSYGDRNQPEVSITRYTKSEVDPHAFGERLGPVRAYDTNVNVLAEYPNYHAAMLDVATAQTIGTDLYGFIKNGTYGIKDVPPPAAPVQPQTPRRSASEMLGEGSVQAGITSTFVREMAESQYSGAINKAAVKEGGQNSVDSSRGIPGAVTKIITDNTNHTVAVVDQGTGMSPATLEEEFAKFGGSGPEKGMGTTGGKGTAAKSAIMGQAKEFWLRTVWRDPLSGKLYDSVLKGNADNFFGEPNPFNGKPGLYRYTTEYGSMPDSVFQEEPGVNSGAPTEIKDWESYHPNDKITGTAFWVTPNKLTNWDEWEANHFAEQFQKTNRLQGQDVEFIIDGRKLERGMSKYGYDIEPEKLPTEYVDRVETPNATIKFYVSPNTQESSSASVLLMNAGQFQATQYVGLAGSAKIPVEVAADIIPKVGPKQPGYPWTPDRNALNDIEAREIKNFVVKKLQISAIQRENDNFKNAIATSPKLGSTNLLVTDETGTIERSTLTRIASTDTYQQLAKAYEYLHNELYDKLRGKTVPGAGDSSIRIGPSRFLGIGIGTNWEAINLPSSITPNKLNGTDRGIFMEPWALWRQAVRLAEDDIFLQGLGRGSRPSPEQIAQKFIDLSSGTMLHELMHNDPMVGGHGPAPMGALTRAPAVIGMAEYSKILSAFENKVKLVLNNPYRTQVLSNDATTFNGLSGSTFGKYGESSASGPGSGSSSGPYDQHELPGFEFESRAGPPTEGTSGNAYGGDGNSGNETRQSIGSGELSKPVEGNGLGLGSNTPAGKNSRRLPAGSGSAKPSDEQIILHALADRAKAMGLDVEDVRKQLWNHMGNSGSPPPGWGTTNLFDDNYRDPTKPLTWREYFNETHRNNVVSGLSTLTHVALNTIVSPVLQEVPRIAADTVGGVANAMLNPHGVAPSLLGRNVTIGIDPKVALGRTAGRMMGYTAGWIHLGSDLMEGFHAFYSNPAAPFNRTSGMYLPGVLDNPSVRGFIEPAIASQLKTQGGLGSAWHAALQQTVQNNLKRIEQMGYAGEKAVQEGYTPLTKEFGKRVEEIMQDPDKNLPAKQRALAEDFAARGALRGPATAYQRTLQNIASVPYIGNTLFPVVKMAAQVMAKQLEYSPLGLASTAFDVAVSPFAGPYKAHAGTNKTGQFNVPGRAVAPMSDRLTAGIVGTGIALWLAQKALDDTITGQGPSDNNAKQTLRAQGWQEHSIHVPGMGYVDYQRLSLLGVNFALAGAYGDAVKYSPTNANLEEKAGAFVQSMLNWAYSASFFETFGEIANIMKGGGGVEKALETLAGQVAGGFVPESGLVKSITLTGDPTAHKPDLGTDTNPQTGQVESAFDTARRGITQTIEQNIPGLRQNVPVAQDTIGRVQANPEYAAGALLPRIGKGTPDPILAAYTQSGMGLPAVPTHVNYQRVDLPLTLAEQKAYAEYRGQALYRLGHGYIDTPNFQNKSEDIRLAILHRVADGADTIAKNKILAEMPPVYKQARLVSAKARQEGKHPQMAAP